MDKFLLIMYLQMVQTQSTLKDSEKENLISLVLS